jgi:hypothetical protein
MILFVGGRQHHASHQGGRELVRGLRKRQDRLLPAELRSGGGASSLNALSQHLLAINYVCVKLRCNLQFIKRISQVKPFLPLSSSHLIPSIVSLHPCLRTPPFVAEYQRKCFGLSTSAWQFRYVTRKELVDKFSSIELIRKKIVGGV